MPLSLYARGLSINKIAQYFKVSPPRVLRWIRTLGKTVRPKPDAEGQVIMELDEMWHYLKISPINSASGKLMILVETDSWIGNVGLVERTRIGFHYRAAASL
ncbi:MAG: hypothetical protein K2X53_04070 [Alphaproteobacteria bacterium]|nr:hypothetical protein [Alphaproteobacteria bacterium]